MSYLGIWCQSLLLAISVASVANADNASSRVAQPSRSPEEQRYLVEHGRYLATIGACAACHTAPDVTPAPPASTDTAGIDIDRRFRTDPDWFRYLDPQGKNALAGGVPFNLRFSGTSNGTVYSMNITPDPQTGIEPCQLGKQPTATCWTEDELVEVIRTGRRKTGSTPASLYLFPPHSFYSNLAEEDARALAVYLRSLTPIANNALQQELGNRRLPADQQTPPAQPTARKIAPRGRSLDRGFYLINSLVGCRECHSYQKFTAQGPVVQAFQGGDPADPFLGVFRLGPDLPLRANEKGFAVFPYPGYAVMYSPNLTVFGLGGPLNQVSNDLLVRAIRQGIAPMPDPYGRPDPIAHIMLWQFYSSMTDDDAYSIAEYVKTLQYVPHSTSPRLLLFGDNWEAAFTKVFGSFNVMTGSPANMITAEDRKIFGKK